MLVENAPVDHVDVDGTLLHALLNGAVNAGLGLALDLALGNPVSLAHVATDFLIGMVPGPGPIGTCQKLARLGKLIRVRGLVRQHKEFTWHMAGATSDLRRLDRYVLEYVVCRQAEFEIQVEINGLARPAVLGGLKWTVQGSLWVGRCLSAGRARQASEATFEYFTPGDGTYRLTTATTVSPPVYTTPEPPPEIVALLSEGP